MKTALHPLHREICTAIQNLAAECGARYSASGDKYIGSSKPIYYLRATIAGQIAFQWARAHSDLTLSETVRVLDSLARGETTNEFWFIGSLLSRMPETRHRLNPRYLARWLAHAQGWAEVDSLCQTTFHAEDLLSNWDKWHKQLVSMSQNKNIHLRRASLVLLTRPVKESDDRRLADLAFQNVERLKGEKHILITKAVSWILRALIKNHRQRVVEYLDANEATLPRTAIRETRIKLKTGRKSGRLA